jgi:diguanylate cyclase (GGDEF)-like protein
MFQRLAQIRSGRDAFLAALAITAAAVALAVALTALATMDAPKSGRWHGLVTATWVSFVIGSIFSYWFAASFRAIVRLKDKVDRLARTDDLTGLDNRRAFLAAAERRIARAGRDGEALSLLILDLDHFKGVNDTHGHRVGDLVLVAMAEILAQSVRPGLDVLGRLGGEEFAVQLARCDEETALGTAERIRVAVESARVATPAGDLGMSVSVGCASIAAPESLSAALQKADEALYVAKRAGRNRVAIYDRGSGGADLPVRSERQLRAAAAESLRRAG